MQKKWQNKNVNYRQPTGVHGPNINSSSTRKSKGGDDEGSNDEKVDTSRITRDLAALAASPNTIVTENGTVATASSTISRGRPASVVNVSSINKGRSKNLKDTIKIVIRDAKPPMVARVLQFTMRVICFLLLVAVCGIGIPRLFGINEFNVLTGSLTPTYPIGSLVFVQPKDPTTIRPGEVVSCIMNENIDIVTHRVTANDYQNKMVYTKGDANNTEDAPTLYENVVGVVVFSIPYVGGTVDYLTNDDTGRVLGIGILLSILALTFLAEAICSFLTKQKANVFSAGKNKPPTVVNAKPVYKSGKEIKAVDKNSGNPIPTKTVKKKKIF